MSTRRVDENVAELFRRRQLETNGNRFVGGAGNISASRDALLGRGMASPVVTTASDEMSVSTSQPLMVTNAVLEAGRIYLFHAIVHVQPNITFQNWSVQFTVAGGIVANSIYLTHGSVLNRTETAEAKVQVDQDMNCLVSATISVSHTLSAGSQFSVRDIGPAL